MSSPLWSALGAKTLLFAAGATALAGVVLRPSVHDLPSKDAVIRPAPADSPPAEPPVKQAPATPVHAAAQARAGSVAPTLQRVVYDPADALSKGPLEPLIAPEIRVDAIPAPRSVVSSEPLIPVEIIVDAEAAPRNTVSLEPLIPPEIPAGDLPVGAP